MQHPQTPRKMVGVNIAPRGRMETLESAPARRVWSGVARYLLSRALLMDLLIVRDRRWSHDGGAGGVAVHGHIVFVTRGGQHWVCTLSK